MSKHISLVTVKVIKGDINRALKKYKKKVSESGHIQELKERKTYTKPKTVRRKQKQKAIRENTKQVLFEKWLSGDNSITMFTKKKPKSNNSNKKDKNDKNLLEKNDLDNKS